MSAASEFASAPVVAVTSGMVALPASAHTFLAGLTADLAAVKAAGTTGGKDTAVDAITAKLNPVLQRAADKLIGCTPD
jgi:hypothetical protein